VTSPSPPRRSGGPANCSRPARAVGVRARRHPRRERRPPADARERGLACALIALYRRRRAGSRHLGRAGEWLEVSGWSSASSSDPRGATGACAATTSSTPTATASRGGRQRGSPLPYGRAVRLRGRVERHTRSGRTAVTVLAYSRVLS
jgi:hypothetical protein